jgi:hypothetical protein
MKLQKNVLISSAVALVGAFALAVPVFAASPNWTLNDPVGVTFMCGGSPYSHTLDSVTNNPDGSFTGTGMYDANNAYTWSITGLVSGSSINFAIVYTGLNIGYTVNGVGTIAPDGSISGTADGNCQTFSMPAGSAMAIPVAVVPTDKNQCKKGGWMTLVDSEGNGFKNQGDCVSFVATGGKNPGAGGLGSSDGGGGVPTSN